MSCQPRRRWCRWRLNQQSGRELGAAFCAAALQNKAPCFRRHTGAKPVRACALDFTWLIRTFHLPGTWFSAGRSMTCNPEGRQEYADALTVSIDARKRWAPVAEGLIVRPIWRRLSRRYRLPGLHSNKANRSFFGDSIGSRDDALESMRP